MSPPAPKTFVETVWPVILCGAIVFGPVSLGTSYVALNVALFDLLVPAIAALGLWRGWLSWPSKRIVLVTGTALVLVFLHSAGTYFLSDGTVDSLLYRATAKLLAVVLWFACLMVIFQDERFRFLPRRALPAATIAAALLYLTVNKLDGGNFSLYAFATTTMAVTVNGLCFLSICETESASTRRKILNVGLALAICAFNAAFLHKTFFSIGVALLICSAYSALGFSSPIKSRAICLFFAAGLTLAGLAVPAMLGIGTTDSIKTSKVHMAIRDAYGVSDTSTAEASMARRSELWEHAAKLGVDAFPGGIGLGQFGTETGRPDLRFPHNTVLSFFTEMGLVGVVFLIFAGVFAWKAAAAYEGIGRIMYFAYLGPTILMNDAHGFRVLLVVIALGFARTLYRSRQEV